MLRDSHDRSFSERSVARYIDALKNYKFVDENRRRDYLISSVNSFGTHNKSARESAQYAMAQTVTQIGQVMREAMSQTAQALAQTLPLIPDIFSQLGRSIVLMQETLPLLRQTLPQIAQSLAQIPVVLPQLQREFAASHRSLPQTLSLLANLKLNVGQN